MCTNRIWIKNPKKKLTLLDRKSLNVNCGKCVECEFSRQMDYYSRCCFEFLEVKKNHGFALAVTLTYSDDTIPYYQFGLSKDERIAVFSREHINKYFQIIRNYFRSIFGKDIFFRWILVCEYGDTLCRPHYHLIFFVHDHTVNPRLFTDIVLKSWAKPSFVLPPRKRTFKGFGFGISYTSNINNGICLNTAPFRYLSAYVNKDKSFSDKYYKLYKTGKSLVVVLPHQSKFIGRPFNRVARGLGSYALQLLKYSDYVEGLYTDSYFPNGIRIPSYVVRKKFFRTIPNYRDVSQKLSQDEIDLRIKSLAEASSCYGEKLITPSNPLYMEFISPSRTVRKGASYVPTAEGLKYMSDVAKTRFDKVLIDTTFLFDDYSRIPQPILYELQNTYGLNVLYSFEELSDYIRYYCYYKFLYSSYVSHKSYEIYSRAKPFTLTLLSEQDVLKDYVSIINSKLAFEDYPFDDYPLTDCTYNDEWLSEFSARLRFFRDHEDIFKFLQAVEKQIVYEYDKSITKVDAQIKWTKTFFSLKHKDLMLEYASKIS